jgi:integrase
MLIRTAVGERNGYVFKGQDGKSITYSHFRKRHFYPVIRALGLKFKTHDLKKFLGACHRGMNKTDITIISKWMGHRDSRVTLSTYAKVIQELEQEQTYDIGNALMPNAV